MSEPIKRPNPSIAAQALAEARARHALLQTGDENKKAPKEIGGRGGQDPARFGDWEVRGITYDF